jgi:hypothetical protein
MGALDTCVIKLNGADIGLAPHLELLRGKVRIEAHPEWLLSGRLFTR